MTCSVAMKLAFIDSHADEVMRISAQILFIETDFTLDEMFYFSSSEMLWWTQQAIALIV